MGAILCGIFCKNVEACKSGSFFEFPSGNILEGTFPSRLSDVHLCVHHYFYLHKQKGGSNQEL